MSFFLYTRMGEKMTIYLDVVFFLNFFFDFLLLLTVNNTLRRNSSLKRLFLGALIGSLTIFLLFISMTSLVLFLIKILISILMCVASFGLKDRRYTIQNLSYFYMTSTVLGGFLYFLQLSFSENQNGLIFTYDQVSISYVFLVIISPIMLYIYIKQRREVSHYERFYEVKIFFLDGKCLSLNSYLDTGNKLVDPITKKKIVLVSSGKIQDMHFKRFIYVPYHSLNHHGLMKCVSIDHLEVGDKKSKNYLVGISEGDLLSDGVECVLNASCLEELL